MIQKYEGFFSNLFKKKVVDPVKNTPSISYDEIVEFINDSFIELIDNGYTVKNKYMVDPYVQITKHPHIKGRLRQDKDIPYKLIDIKGDILSFHDRLKDYGVISIEYAFVYENDKGGLSIDYPKYEELDNGLYDNREVNIFTINFKISNFSQYY